MFEAEPKHQSVFRVDADRATWAGPGETFYGLHGSLGVLFAAGCFDHLGNHVHAIEGADRELVQDVSLFDRFAGMMARRKGQSA